MGTTIVTTYRNPDLDGVASAIALAGYLEFRDGGMVTPVLFGQLDPETAFVMQRFEIEPPRSVGACPPADALYIVDTHDPAQLDPSIPVALVRGIIDHHTSGDPSAFPNATIQNEAVGAVATLLAEQFDAAAFEADPALLRLLHAAIISNTLNFTTPSTTDRDREAAAWLTGLAPIPSGFAEEMLQARSQFGTQSTAALLATNLKPFTFAGISYGIVQIEGIGVEEVLARTDLISELTILRNAQGLEHAFATGVDVGQGATYVIADGPETRHVLSGALGMQFANSILRIGRVLQRKTDFVPQLSAYYDSISSKAALGGQTDAGDRDDGN
jgi:manganese-dependent inorganic pyrophosphatase